MSSKVRLNQLLRERERLNSIKDHASFQKHFNYLIEEWQEIVSFLLVKIQRALLVYLYYDHDGPPREESLQDFLNRYEKRLWEQKRELSENPRE